MIGKKCDYKRRLIDFRNEVSFKNTDSQNMFIKAMLRQDN